MTPHTATPTILDCRLHEAELKDINKTVTKLEESMNKLDQKLDRLFGAEGVVWNMRDEVTIVRTAAARAHERIDTAEIELRASRIAHEELSKDHNALARRMTGVASIPGLITLAIILMAWAMKAWPS